jgi:hypothetical protein
MGAPRRAGHYRFQILDEPGQGRGLPNLRQASGVPYTVGMPLRRTLFPTTRLETHASRLWA